ncbi:MAG: class I SAM-dependent methyltransferase [Cyanobacteria bacterium P01_A01_bin.45]
MNVQEAYNNWSLSYDSDKNRTRDLDFIVTQDSLKDFSGKSILELGCGTGKNTIFFSQIAQRVISVDFSEEMIQKAKQKVEADSKADNIHFITADITEPWNFLNFPIDLIVCNLVLEHIENLPFIFAQAFDSLKSGGHFFICELHPFKQYQGSVARFNQNIAASETVESIEIKAFVHHASEFFNSAQNAGFTMIEFKEWWHETDENKPPRLISFLFQKPNGSVNISTPLNVDIVSG